MAHPKRRQSINKVLVKWHILKEDNQKRELLREELMIKQLLLLWLFAQTAANGMCITQYVELAATTEVN